MQGKYDIDLGRVALSWEMASEAAERRTGKMSAYSSLELNGRLFAGDRPFELRWNLITDHFDFAAKRVLDCGCYLGLFSTFLTIHHQAVCVAFDRDPRFCAAAQNFADAFGAKVTILNVDLNLTPNWESILAGDYDVALVLNIWKYCPDRDRLAAFLAQIPALILEGEVRQEQDALDHLTRFGFHRHQVLGVSERNRKIFLLQR